MKKIQTLILVGGFVFFAGCSWFQTQPQSIYDQLVLQVEQKLDKKMEPLLVTRWFPDEELKGMYHPQDIHEKGYSFRFVSEVDAVKIYNQYHHQFVNEGYQLFFTNLDFDENYDVYFDIGLVKTNDIYDVVRLIDTNGGNYDISNQDVIDKLKEFEKLAHFSIFVIDDDRIEAELLRQPDDVTSFAQAIYDFSPDTVDQGAGSVEELINIIEQEQFFWFWWD